MKRFQAAKVGRVLPVSSWTVLGPATEVTPGQYRFTDPAATNQPHRFYRVRWP